MAAVYAELLTRMPFVPNGFTFFGCRAGRVAQCWTLRDGAREEQDVMWSGAAEPMHDAVAVEGLLCLFEARLDLDVGV